MTPEIPQLDYARVNVLYMSGGHTVQIKIGTYNEYALPSGKEMFVAQLGDYVYGKSIVTNNDMIVGAADFIIAMSFKPDPSTK